MNLPKKPLIGVIHLVPSLSYAAFPGRDEGLRALVADVRAMTDGGLDGVLIENDSDKPHTLVVNKAQVAWLTQAAIAARDATALPVGIGVQRIDWEATLAIAAAANLPFVRIDVFVDRVRMQGEDVVVDPAEIRAYRASVRGDAIELWTDVHVKHAELVEGTSIRDAAARAKAEGSAAILVSGTRTGEPPSLGDLEAVSGLGARVIVGSGLTAENAHELAPLADGAVVGTSLKEGDRISIERVKKLVAAWRRACG